MWFLGATALPLIGSGIILALWTAAYFYPGTIGAIPLDRGLDGVWMTLFPISLSMASAMAVGQLSNGRTVGTRVKLAVVGVLLICLSCLPILLVGRIGQETAPFGVPLLLSCIGAFAFFLTMAMISRTH